MKLEDIKTGMVLWNKWEYSIMGRDTGTNSDFFLIIEPGIIERREYDGKSYNVIKCQAKTFSYPETKQHSFSDEEIPRGWLRLATKEELLALKIKIKGEITSSIMQHKTQIELLELQLSSLDSKYKEFIENAL
jgi:hypothetical protein